MTNFSQVFKAATGSEPYPYQETLASTLELPEILIAPTGAGKTAAVVMSHFPSARCAMKRHTPNSTLRSSLAGFCR